MSRGTLIGAAFAVGLALAGLDGARAADPRLGAGPPVIRSAAVESGLQFISLGVSKALVINLPRDVKDVLVADPGIANAVVRSARRAYLIGVKVGQTNILFFDAEGRQLAGYEIAVTRDLNGIREALKRTLPQADIRVEGLGERSVVLSGTVATPAESQLAYDLAARLVSQAPGTSSSSNTTTGADGTSSTSGRTSGSGGDTPVVNALTIRGRDQVMLKVTVAEVQRDVIKQLGINLSGSIGYGSSVLNFNTQNPFSASGQALSSTAITPGFMGGANANPNPGSFVDGTGAFRNSIQATLQAMERAGVIRTLAEPSVTAISGESANFLAGGEFPYPVVNPGTPPTISTEFKKFGVSLMFTPVVLSEGRISLKVMTEVSELSNEGGVTVAGTTVPGLKTRRADTTVEIPSGGALVMAGMIREQSKQAINGLPGLMQVPVIGALFKSREFINSQTELMILVTPYVVRAVAPKDLSRPDDGFADTSDPAAILMGRLNRVYGVTGSVDPRRTYYGKYGFILD